jgi:hypothetical protein
MTEKTANDAEITGFNKSQCPDDMTGTLPPLSSPSIVV